MFVYDFVTVDRPFGSVADHLTGRDGAAFAGLKVGAARSVDGTVVVPIRWLPCHDSAPFDRLDGALQLAPFEAEGSHLSLSGHYDEPINGLGRREDSHRVHREAEMSVRSFLHELAAALEHGEA